MRVRILETCRSTVSARSQELSLDKAITRTASVLFLKIFINASAKELSELDFVQSSHAKLNTLINRELSFFSPVNGCCLGVID